MATTDDVGQFDCGDEAWLRNLRRPATAEMAASIVDLRGVTEFSGAGETGSQKIFLSDAVMIDVSATDIRRAVSESDNEKLTKLVPLEVAEYIRKYRLYRNTTDD